MSKLKPSFKSWYSSRFKNRDAVKAFAEKIVLDAGIARPPVHLAKIAQFLGVNPLPIYPGNLTHGGALDFVDGNLRILLKNRDPFPKAGSMVFRKMKFSYAHELAHSLMYDLSQAGQLL